MASATATSTKNYLITGAGRGIGRGLSRLLLSTGHRVFLVDNDDTELTHTAGQLAKSHKRGEDFDAALCDVRQPGQVREAAAQADKLFRGGRLDCLVNNAAYTGGVGGSRLEDMTLEEWNRSLETNLTGPMLMTQACLGMLRRRPGAATKGSDGKGTASSGGCVIHMSSTRAFMSELDNEAYSTTKAGLVGLTQSMATSLGARPETDIEGDPPVRVSAILPGWIHVENECKAADDSGATAWEEGLGEEDMRWQVTGRVGRVEDVWRAVVYLVENEGVTGAEMVVDGGVTRKMVYPE